MDTMQGPVEDDAGRSASRVRRLATPIEVAACLQVPVKTLYAWRYGGLTRFLVAASTVTSCAGPPQGPLELAQLPERAARP